MAYGNYEKEWERKMDDPRWRGKGRGYGKREHVRRTFEEEKDTDDASNHYGHGRHARGRGERHPRGLRGREIGLWYSKQNKGRPTDNRTKAMRQRNEEFQNRTFITMDKSREREISDLLKNIQAPLITSQNPRSYSNYTSPLDDDDDNNDDDDDNDDDDYNEEMMKLNSRRQHCKGSSDVEATSSKACFDMTLDAIEMNDATCSMPFQAQNESTDNLNTYINRSNHGGSTKSDIFVSSSLCSEVDDDLIDGTMPSYNNVLSYEKSFVDLNDDDDDDDDDDTNDADLANLTVRNLKSVDVVERDISISVTEDEDEEKDEENETAFTSVNLYRCEKEEDDVSKFFIQFCEQQKQKGGKSEEGRYHGLVRNGDLDHSLMHELRSKKSLKSYCKMIEWRKNLPTYKMKAEILSGINSSQVVVIRGETGCGKTTQVTQFILDEYIETGNGSLCHIVCTQPRRISAISIAERVADERSESLGDSVGYQIRLEHRLPKKQGSILYCTTGILLKSLESDPWLSATSHIILDEVHERDILCDFLMIILRDLIMKRRNLKLILMSATLNAEHFSAYFGDCPMISIPGFTFPVKEYFLESIIDMIRFKPNPSQHKYNCGKWFKNKKEEQIKANQYQDWIKQSCFKYSKSTVDILRNFTCDSNIIDYDLFAALIHYIVLNRPDGAILVFVPGWEEIRKMTECLFLQPIFNSGNFLIIPLHSLMPTVNQKEVFERPPSGKRKIIIATNIAETSITIDDVVYVVDCGTMKMKNFDAANNLSTLQSDWISRANAKQRRGRAGRVCPGECYHLYTSFHETQFEDFQKPEMLRTRLEELCLQIKLLKLGKIKEFVVKAMNPPPLDSLQLSIRTLIDLNALDVDEELTPLGYHLAKMPVDPHSGKMLLFAAIFSCLDPILTVAASLSFKNAFYVPMGHEQKADERRKKLSNGTKSDHLMLVNAYEGWEGAKSDGSVYSYCRYNYLSANTLKMLHNMRKQFSQLLYDMGFTFDANPKSRTSNRNSANGNLIKAVVCSGLYPNIAKLNPIKSHHSKRPLLLHTKYEQSVYVHPKSVNFSEREFSSRWFVYHMKMKTKKIYLYDCTPVSPYPLLFFGGNITFRKDLGQNCVVIDDWITFGASKRTATLVQELRIEFDKLIEWKITHPGVTKWEKAEKEGVLMRAIVDLLTTEETLTSKYLQRKH